MEFKGVTPERFIAESIKAEDLPACFNPLPRVIENDTIKLERGFRLSRIWGGKSLETIARDHQRHKQRCTDRYPMALHGPPSPDCGLKNLKDDEIRCAETTKSYFLSGS